MRFYIFIDKRESSKEKKRKVEKQRNSIDHIIENNQKYYTQS
jgi:hypothetical protein